MRWMVRRPTRPALRAAVVFGFALLAMGQVAAVSLGRPQGDALLGRALRMAVPIVPDRPGESPCIQAALQQGDEAPVPLQWALEAVGADAWQIRLRSTEIVREPVITVTVSVGCGMQFTRGYVLLAETPRANEPSYPLVQAPAESASEGPVSLPSVGSPAASEPRATPAPSATAAAPRRARPARERPAGAPAATRPSPAEVMPAPRVASQRKEAPAPSRQQAAAAPRLRVQLFDFQVDQAPMLRLTMALEKPPAAEDPRRAEAAAAWQAAQKAPEAVAAQVVQAQNLRATQARQDEAARILAESRLRAEEQRNQMLLIAAGAVLGLAALAWLVVRRRRSTRAAAPAAAVRSMALYGLSESASEMPPSEVPHSLDSPQPLSAMARLAGEAPAEPAWARPPGQGVMMDGRPDAREPGGRRRSGRPADGFEATMEAPLVAMAPQPSTMPMPLAPLEDRNADDDPLHGVELDFSDSMEPPQPGGRLHA